MPELNDIDVLIVGAGPTGLTVANYLGMCGVRVLVVERNAGTVAEPRAVSIDDESLRTMQAIGLIDRVREHIVEGYGARYYSPGQREFARVKPKVREFGHARRSAFHQPVLEATLRDGLGRFPCVDILFGHTFERFEQDAEGVTATVRDASGAARTIRASLLAACDGGRSSIRKALGVELKGSSFEERWLVFDMVDDSDDTPDSIAYCDHRRPAISLPGPNRTRRWEFLVHKGENADEFTRDEKIAALLAPYGGLGGAKVIRRIVYTFHARVAEKWGHGRVFLLGDAAHLTPPYAGQGMNSGQRDALNFAWKAAAVVCGKLDLAVMDSYESERRAHARSLIRMAIQIGWVMVPRNWLHTYGQIAFFRLAGFIPALRDYFLQMKFKPVPRFREGLVLADGESAKATLVGRMLPQPAVRDADGRDCLLDAMLGPGFALLALDLDPETAFSGLDQPVWTALDARRVVLRYDGGVPPGPDGVCVAGTAAPVSAGFARYRQRILLVRPDRYVAAAFA
ncbi:MAG: bifunctional 3-(3-hydroxy-phenyl)propionate/3-hydroxycinnamic acid hydroxylase, partial [Rhodospirillaceae bacterium]